MEPDSPYGASKLAEEKLSLAYGKLYPLEAVALRYFNVYGRHQRYDAYGNVIPIFARRIFRRESIVIFGDGEQTRDFVNVSDVATANLAAGRTAGVRGAFNVGSGSRVTINQLAQLMIELSGIPVPIEYARPRSGDVRDSQADIRAAHAAFGFAPTVELRRGLADYLNWAREAAVFA